MLTPKEHYSYFNIGITTGGRKTDIFHADKYRHYQYVKVAPTTLAQ